jgi:putative ABC transport system permease protein
LRNGLVVFQFTISIFLIIATLAISAQTNFMQQVDLGFDKDQIIRMKDVTNAGDRLYNFREELLKNPAIKDVTVSSYFPGPGSARKTPLVWRYGTEPSPSNAINIEKWTVDYDYIPTLDMQVVSGRNFSREFMDSSSVIVNESTVWNLGLGPDPIGKKLSLFHDNPDGSQDQNQLETYLIIGVVKDFNYESLRQNIQPLGLFFGRSTGSIAIRYETHDTEKVIDALKNTWKRIAPGEPFNYSFLDEDFDRTYNTEKKLSSIFFLFSGLAVAIACLGLFALTAFTVEQRTKEIGIRKVLGASVSQLVALLSLAFSRLILISFVFAAPLAGYGIHLYLRQYAYKADISPWLYLEAGLIACVLSALTIGYQSVKAARLNPVDSLKIEG